MSNVATAGLARSGRLVPVALTLALAAAVGWVVAALWADEPLGAIVVGGLVAAQVAAYVLAWALGEVA